MSESDLLEIKVPSRSQCRVDALYLMEKWVQSEKVLERHVQMAFHMRLLYSLSDRTDLAALWSKEVEMQVEHARLVASGQAFCVRNVTNAVLEFVSRVHSKIAGRPSSTIRQNAKNKAC